MFSFSIIPFLGERGSGKTFNMLKMAQQYIDLFRHSKYNLDKYNIANGPITHCVFITPNANDITLLKDPIRLESCFRKIVIGQVNNAKLNEQAVLIMNTHDETEQVLI